MLQALEWEPSGSLYRTRVGETGNNLGASGHFGVVEEIADPSLPPNPHKYILYRPSVQHLLLVSSLLLFFSCVHIIRWQLLFVLWCHIILLWLALSLSLVSIVCAQQPMLQEF